MVYYQSVHGMQLTVSSLSFVVRMWSWIILNSMGAVLRPSCTGVFTKTDDTLIRAALTINTHNNKAFEDTKISLVDA